MKSHISKVRIAALAVGLAIVMSSCGIQNQAGDSSAAPAGKTKNYALNNSGACFDDEATWYATWTDRYAYWESVGFGEGYNAEFAQLMPVNWLTGADWDTFFRDLNNGELCPSGGIASVENEDQSSTGSSTQICVKPEIKQAIIDGYASQVNRPLGGEVTEEYIAKMQKGLDVANAMCTN